MGALEDKLKKIITDAVIEQYNAGFNAGYATRKAEEKEEDTHTMYDLYRRGYKQGYADAQAEIGEIDISDLKDGWILCEDKMPREGEPVLVCDLDYGCEVMWYFDYDGVIEWESIGENREVEDIVAWQPLPTPYMTDEQREELDKKVME